MSTQTEQEQEEEALKRKPSCGEREKRKGLDKLRSVWVKMRRVWWRGRRRSLGGAAQKVGFL